MLAHGGIGVLAVVFALAFATFGLANALAQVLVSVLNQQVSDADFGGLTFDIFGTTIYYEPALQTSLAILFLCTALWGLWRIVRKTVRTCPECLSDIPRHATVCRYCTTEQGEAEG